MTRAIESNWTWLLKTGIRLLIPVLFFFYVFHIIRPNDLIMALGRAQGVWFSLGALSVFALHTLCSFRTRKLLFANGQSLARLWAVHSLTSLVVGLLPFRTGELSYIYYLRKYCVVPASEGTAILIAVRFAEYLIFLLLICGLSFVGAVLMPSGLNWCVFAVIATNVGLVLALLWNGTYILKPFKSLSRFAIGSASANTVQKPCFRRQRHSLITSKPCFPIISQHDCC